jgi:4a-hydroxytetrahydrobiopterin dehydratase
MTTKKGEKKGFDGWECEKQPLRPISSSEAEAFVQDLPGWSLKDKNIEREFCFGDFKDAIEFVDNVALLSEAQEHHPDILISYNRVRLTLSTHKIDALSCRDFALAAMIDRVTESKDE